MHWPRLQFFIVHLCGQLCLFYPVQSILQLSNISRNFIVVTFNQVSVKNTVGAGYHRNQPGHQTVDRKRFRFQKKRGNFKDM